MACRQLVKPSTLCLHLSPTLFVRILPSTRYVHPLFLPPQSAINPLHHLNYSSLGFSKHGLNPKLELIMYVCQFGARRCNFQSCGIEKTVAGGRKMCCSVCYNGLPLLSLLARMAALADACSQYGWCACCAFSLPNAVCRYSVDKLRVCLHS